MEIILVRSTWQAFVLSFSKAQRSRFHANPSMEPKLKRCTFKLSIMQRDGWDVQRAAISYTYLDWHFSEPHLLDTDQNRKQKQSTTWRLRGRNHFHGPPSTASKRFTDHSDPNSCLSLQACHTHYFFPSPLERWSWGSRNQLRKEAGGRLGLLVKPRCVHAEKSGQLGVGCGVCREDRLEFSPHPLQCQGTGLRQPPFTSQQNDFSSFFSLALGFQARCWKTFPVYDQTVNIVGSVGNLISVTSIQCCHVPMRAVTGICKHDEPKF